MLLTLVAISLPIALIVVAAVGGGLALVALAIATMLAITAAAGVYVGRLTTRDQDGRGAGGERDERAHAPRQRASGRASSRAR